MRDRWSTARTEAFSDGVFAIAITLLVLEIGVPESDFDHLWYGIGHQWPSYLAYATSFVTIGGIWMIHHGLFGRLQYANAQIMRVNLGVLMAVSFLPYPTGLMAEAIRNSGAERAAVLFYGCNLLVISALMGALWAVAARHRELVHPDVSDQEVQQLLRATTPDLGFYVTVSVIALLAPHVAVWGYLVIGIRLVTRARSDDVAAPATG